MSKLGPLPGFAPEFRPRWPGDKGGFTAKQMRSYAQQEVEKERERCLNDWNGLLLELRHMADDSADRGDVFAQRVVALLSRA